MNEEETSIKDFKIEEKDDCGTMSQLEKHSTANLDDLAKWKIIALTFGMIGNQLIWALQNGNASAYFLSMGMPDFLVGLAWLAGPIGGIIVQPVIGTFSDRNEAKWGRRRPFMVGSLIAVLICCAIFSNAVSLGEFFGDSDGSHIIGLSIAVAGFWALDCSINGLQSMLRSLYIDLAPPSQHSEGMAWFSLMNSFGNIIGYGLGMFNYVQFGFKTNVQALYLIGSVILIFTVFVTLIIGKEKTFKLSTEEKERITKSKSRTCGTFREIGSQLWVMMKNILKFPKPLRVIFVIQFFAWFSWFIIMLYATIWMGIDIYGGDPDAAEGTEQYDNYNKGVQIGNGALMIQALLAMIYALCLPKIMDVLDIRISYGFAQILQGACMLLAFWITEPWQAVAMLAVLAIPWSSTWTIPWSLTSTAVTNSPHKALYLGTLNLSQVLPEIFCGLFANVVLFINDDLGVLISIGGVVALFSFIFVPFISINDIFALADIEEIDDTSQNSSSSNSSNSIPIP